MNRLDARTCENCHCFENCMKLAQFCRQMVFRVRRLDITLVDHLAASCPFFILAAERTASRAEDQPFLFVVNSN